MNPQKTETWSEWMKAHHASLNLDKREDYGMFLAFALVETRLRAIGQYTADSQLPKPNPHMVKVAQFRARAEDFDLQSIVNSHIGQHNLTRSQLLDLDSSTGRVFDLMKDGEWHDATTIIAASGVREGLRRMRTLRQHGHVIEREKVEHDRREYRYRLIIQKTN